MSPRYPFVTSLIALSALLIRFDTAPPAPDRILNATAARPFAGVNRNVPLAGIGSVGSEISSDLM